MKAYIIAEIGINHNGDIQTALQMMEKASECGADAVKFQKRTLPNAVPSYMWNDPKETPWGHMTYLHYKELMEFGLLDYSRISEKARELGIDWSASVWDVEAYMFMDQFNPVWVKVPSAMNQNFELMDMVYRSYPIIVSLGGLSHSEVMILNDRYPKAKFLHCVSNYPAKPEELNLLVIPFLRSLGVDMGYSGHETGLATSVAAVALGASIVERHFTLDRSMWGSDQSASVEPTGFARMVKDIRAVETALGDCIKRPQVGESEKLETLGWRQ